MALHCERRQAFQNRSPIASKKAAIESVLMYHISLWQRSCTAHDRNALLTVMKTAQKIIAGVILLSIDEGEGSSESD